MQKSFHRIFCTKIYKEKNDSIEPIDLVNHQRNCLIIQTRKWRQQIYLCVLFIEYFRFNTIQKKQQWYKVKIHETVKEMLLFPLFIYGFASFRWSLQIVGNTVFFENYFSEARINEIISR